MGGFQPLTFRDVLQFVPRYPNWKSTPLIANLIRQKFPSLSIRNDLVMARLKVLESQGHVEREREHSHGSSALWTITEAGKAALERGYV